MSNAKQNDDEGSMTSHAHRQTRDRDEEDEGKQHTAQPSSHASPAMRIYRHALEAIFALLDLGDLSHLLAVSREWSAAVRSMKPIHASIAGHDDGSTRERKAYRPLPPIAHIVASPLLCHLAAIEINHIGQWTALDNASLALLTQHAPNLQSLWCMLTLTPNDPLVLPPKLTSLNLQLDDTDAAANGVLATLAALPSLSRLRLRVFAFDKENSVELHLLACCRSLVDLTLENVRGSAPTLSRDQADQIRSSLAHLHRIDVGWLKSDMLACLLQQPVTARWQDIGRMRADEHTGAMLITLPSLTKLVLSYEEDTSDVEFLSQLPLLTTLELDCDQWGEWSIPADALLASLLQCNCISELYLTCGFNSAHWSALFAKLPVKKLTICRGAIETLECFATHLVRSQGRADGEGDAATAAAAAAAAARGANRSSCLRESDPMYMYPGRRSNRRRPRAPDFPFSASSISFKQASTLS